MNRLKRNLLKLVLIVATVLITTITMINLPGMCKEVKASEGTTTNGLKYRIDDDEVIITGYVGKSTKVNIPEKIDGKSVTSIGGFAFSGCSGLTSISIPSSVTSIGGFAFSGCSGLTSISIPSSVTEIGSYAFEDCSSLKSISIPSSVTSIGNYAFSRCSNLTSISIPSSVTLIEWYAFYGCSSLKSISIPSSVTYIGGWAFEGCSSLTSISIPSSVTEIGDGAFSGCSSLTKISVSASNKYYDSRNNCNAIIETASNKLIAGCKNTSIPSSVTEIGDKAFSGCSSLKSISIPSSVTSIGGGAFSGCSSLKSISIPSSVTSIGMAAFSYCSSLKSISIPSSVTLIEWYAFYGCSSLKSISIPKSVGWIASDAFYECSKLTIYCPANSYAEEYAINHIIKHNIPELKSKPSIKSITNTNSGIKLTWGKNSKAKGYKIYRSINGAAYTKIKTIKDNTTVSYTDTMATTNGAKYQYKIVAYKSVSGTTYKSVYSSVKTIYRLRKPTISSASNTSAGKVTVKWNKNGKATGYQIKYVVGTTEKKTKVTSASTLSKVISSLTKGKTYKFYVRSYKTVGKTNYYSAWSSAKSVKITQ